MTTTPNWINVSGQSYVMTTAYIAGALAMRSGHFYNLNPHKLGSQQHSHWAFGHANECAGEHSRFGEDLLKVVGQGKVFDEDPSVTRDEFGVVMPAATMEFIAPAFGA